MKKVQKIGLAILLIFSIGINFILYFKLSDVKEKLDSVNKLISSNVERNIRQSMRYIKELKETNSPDSLKNLQQAIQELAVTYKHWVDLNQTERNPNLQVAKSLSSIEAIRNAFVHHLEVQFQANSKSISQYDIEFLDKAYESLDRMLMIYLNLEGNIAKLRNPNKDYGLIQISGNIEEMTRLYRHSITPNKHPNYITYEEAVKKAEELFPNLVGLELESNKTTPNIKDGIHYFELKFIKNKEVTATLWIDAISNSLRNYELKINSDGKGDISRGEAFEIAKAYLKNFYNGEFISEHYKIEGNPAEKKPTIYSYRFIPTINAIPFPTDAFTINIDEGTGTIIKYSNEAITLELPKEKSNINIEEIQQANLEALGSIEYLGTAVVRSFTTRFKPTLAYSFKSIQKDQEMLLFFDASTGLQIHQIVNVYVPIN